MIDFQCPECNCGMTCPDSLWGQREVCPDCGHACTVPNASSPTEQLPVSTSEPGHTSPEPSSHCHVCGGTRDKRSTICSDCKAIAELGNWSLRRDLTRFLVVALFVAPFLWIIWVLEGRGPLSQSGAAGLGSYCAVLTASAVSGWLALFAGKNLLFMMPNTSYYTQDLWPTFRRWLYVVYFALFVLLIVLAMVSSLNEAFWRWAVRSGNISYHYVTKGIFTREIRELSPFGYFVAHSLRFGVPYVIACLAALIAVFRSRKDTKDNLSLETLLPEGLLALGRKNDWDGVRRVCAELIGGGDQTWTRADLLARVRFAIGLEKLENGDREHARVDFQQALELDAKFVPPKYYTARILVHSGQPSGSVKLLEDFISHTKDKKLRREALIMLKR